MPLDPEKWFQMWAVTSGQDREIVEFGKAMGRTLKFVTDESWSKGDPPKDSINFILPVCGTHKSANHLDTLVLVKAMDITTVIKLENSHIGYLKRLDDWPRKLEQIQTSFRMYSERTSIPLLAVVPGRDEGKVILHKDVCLLANHWKHESAKSWLKALCVLDGVTFHIWVLCFNNSPLALWSGTDVIVEKHPDVQMIMANNDMLKKFKENLPRWKQVFANAVAILPLVLILGKGIGQMLNTSQALQNPIPSLESKAGIHTCQWLQSTEDKWMVLLVRTKGFPHDDVRKVHQCLMFRVQRWDHENFHDFLDEKTGKEPWRLPTATAPLTVEDVDPMLVEEIIVGNLPQSQEHDNSLLNAKEVEYHMKKLTQDDNWSWQTLMLMAPHLRITRNAVPVSALSRKHRSSRSPKASDAKAKKTKVDRNLSWSEIGIHSPLVWVQSTDTHASFDYFPLQSNEADDCEMITAWNDWIVLDNPRYRLPETGKGMDDSMITTMAHSVVMDNPSVTLETFQNYNIYHYMRACHPLSWSLPNLSLVGNVDSIREVQASKEMKDNINVNMSLRELFEEGLKQEGHVLNALALPCMTSYDSNPLQFILSSHCRAFEHTSDMLADIFDTTYPVSATSFWLVATKGAISYMHCDCHGVGMVVEVLCGRKLWYIFQHHGSSANDSMIEEYMGDWAPGFIPSPDEWEAEVVLLEPGSAFYMLKGLVMVQDTDTMLILVLSYGFLQNANLIIKILSILGHHIYATTTLAKSVMGWIHTGMLEYRIANVLHPELHELLLHIMFHYLEIPEMSRNGLLDIITLGNLCIFSLVLLPCIEESPEQVKIEIAMATGAYLSLIRYLKNKVNMWLNMFLHIDLTDKFLYTYKNEQKKCLHLCPVFDVQHKEDILDLGIYNECDMFESSQASIKHMEMKDFDGKETDNEGSFNEEEQSQSGDQDEENSEDASGSEYKP
ncbi:hypothetical protein EDD18DRAFT_1098822 [Armillaria luteobubalina]|uniref:JmjC domain-containing protein n=1 Tax=Armillaria luteobubalina TaxID=153913 RepID=A0AA39QM45_9AGAR|nr:hypothetical protein EDD18DRAFT_1098822 [Armillaria luteobubalina]